MLVPTGMSPKERKEYDKVHVPKPMPNNPGPKAGLRPPGGDKAKEVEKPAPAPKKKKGW